MEDMPVQPAGDRFPSSPAASPSAGASGCLDSALLIFMLLWVAVTTGICQLFTWALEQSIFEGSFQFPDVRWLIVLIYGLVIAAPALIIWLTGKNLRNRHFYIAFMLAGIFAALMAPARLAGVTGALLAALIEIAGGMIFLLLPLGRPPLRQDARGLGIALLVAGVLSFPWVLWGALGSVWDILLNLGAALLFGFAASRVVGVIARPQYDPASRSRLLLDGLVLAAALLVMVTGLGVNGSQGLLSMSVPLLGWALVALYSQAQREDGRVTENGTALALLAGLAAFWPMAFIDPDELSVVISQGPGELLQWANLAGAVTLAIAVAASVVLLMARARLTLKGSAVVTGAAALVWLVAAGLYVGIGQPGLYGERLFVILKDQADLSSQAKIADYNQRRTAVYRALVDKANSSQAGLRKTLDLWRIPYQPYYLENAIEVQGGPLVRWWLLSRPEVDRVLSNPILRPLPEPVPQSRGSSSPPADTPWNIKMIGADRVWNELGVRGKGIIVGQSDSGAQGDHPEVADSYRGQGGSNDYNWFDPWYHTTFPTDIGGHGTHTLGTVLGDKVGVAPDAQWIGCVNLARNLGNPAFYLDCMQFMLAPFPQNGSPLKDGRPEQGAHVLNNSWGCPPVEGCDPNALLPAVSALRAAGVFVVASAGNEGLGGCGSVSDPLALYAQVYSVGAVDRGGQLADFSSTGPVRVDGSDRTKPDIAAPGVDVLSSFPGGTYDVASGTSMAGPHLVGVVALMWSANPALIGDIERTQQILDQTAAAYTGPLPACVKPGHPNDGVGYGIVNAYDAVRLAMGK